MKYGSFKYGDDGFYGTATSAYTNDASPAPASVMYSGAFGVGLFGAGYFGSSKDDVAVAFAAETPAATIYTPE
jgi:hypothetical protein